MTTAAKPIPEHIKSVMADANKMDWDVHCTTSSVKITPPKGSKYKEFTISLTTPPVAPQLQKQLSDRGFLAAVQAWSRSQDPKPEPKKTPTAAPKGQQPTGELLVCAECQAAGVSEPYTTSLPRIMGAHRRVAHGVVGASPEAARRRRQTIAKKAASGKKTPAKKTPAKKATPAKKTEPKTSVPPQRAEAAPLQVNANLLPTPVAEALSTLLTAVTETSGDAVTLGEENEALRKENEELRGFRVKVVELASDGTKAPVQVVSAILDLAKGNKAQ